MGGPMYFSERKGHPALIGRHMTFNMSEKAANRWLLHMKAALAETPEIDSDSAERMMAYFTHTAYFLSIGVTGQQKMQRGE
jgi:truncated hemoglobin YjbI